MSVKDLARELSMPERTVRSLLVSGGLGALPFVRLGRQLRVSRQDFDRWLESKKQTGTPARGGMKRRKVA